MIKIRKSHERGRANLAWLKSNHTFSFADYYDPRFMGFSDLRVINEDYVQAGQGFATHPHKNMEIITYVIAGELEHKDSMGTGSIIRPGEIQRMTAGTGVRHSEYNHSSNDSLHLLQIWILPERDNLPPSYEQKKILQQENELILIGSPEPTEHSIKIHQDVYLYVAYLNPDIQISFSSNPQRNLWLQLIKGTLLINQHRLESGDGAAIQHEDLLQLQALDSKAEFLLFDLAA